MSGSKSLCRWCCKCGLAGVLAALVVAPPAQGQDAPPPPDDISAADAYRESLPTAAGSKPTGESGQAAQLPAEIDARLRASGGTDVQLLREVATRPEYGAPSSTSPVRTPLLSEDSSPNVAVEAVADAVGETRIVILFSLLLTLTVGAVALRLVEARGRSPRTSAGSV